MNWTTKKMDPIGATLIVGMGEVGAALADVLEKRETVLRHDIEPREFEQPVDVMHICFPFRGPDFVDAACEYIERFAPRLTVINSTVLPGTTRSVADRTGVPVAYSPVRGKHVRMTQDLLHYVKFVAATDIDTVAHAEKHFQDAGMKTARVSRPETLELAKLAETTYFGTLIAFAQELNRYAERVGGDYFEITSFFDEIDFLPRVRYFPGFIGGHCVIPNINLLLSLADSPLLRAILHSNELRAAELGERTPQADGVSSGNSDG
jgi:UDP-glucose 6-dehydrogenase